MESIDCMEFDAAARAQERAIRRGVVSIRAILTCELGHSRACSIARTKLDELEMWAVRAVRDEQLAREARERPGAVLR